MLVCERNVLWAWYTVQAHVRSLFLSAFILSIIKTVNPLLNCLTVNVINISENQYFALVQFIV